MLPAVSLGRLATLREALDREGSSPSLQTASALRELVADYVAAPGSEADNALRSILGRVVQSRGQGAGMLVQGPAGAGKSHLLIITALLLEYAPVWTEFLAAHPAYEDIHASLTAQRPLLVVPVPLAEHRGRDEHLEDIIFDHTERELARPKYGIGRPHSPPAS